jgi:methylmalonyl-CoA/ethylmalonyl-CoA epimerase
MAQASPAKVQVKAITEVGLVVKDVRKTAENYWNILGIGPWDIYPWESPLVYDYKYHGRPAWARAKIAITMVGPVMLELVEHIDGDTIYQDWLTEHGEGLHHLSFMVDSAADVDRIAEILANEGFPSLQSARFGDNGAFNYIDIKPLHSIWEATYLHGDIGAKPTHYPGGTQTSPAKVKVNSIFQVGLVVKDVQKAVENYWNILGIGPWDIYPWESPLVYDYKYHGKPAWARAKIAITMVGPVMLELMEHIDGDTIYPDWLMEHGEGLHHLNFLVDSADDVDRTAEILANEGFPSLQSGRFGDNGAFNYIDIKPLRTIWEPDHAPDNMGAKPVHYPLQRLPC